MSYSGSIFEVRRSNRRLRSTAQVDSSHPTKTPPMMITSHTSSPLIMAPISPEVRVDLSSPTPLPTLGPSTLKSSYLSLFFGSLSSLSSDGSVLPSSFSLPPAAAAAPCLLLLQQLPLSSAVGNVTGFAQCRRLLHKCQICPKTPS